MGSFRAKYILFVLKKYRGVIFHDTEEWCKIWKELNCHFKIDMRNLTNFHSLKNSDFILESKMAELIKIKIQNKQIHQIQCENIILPWK